MLVASMFILFGVSIAYVLYKLIRKMMDIFGSFNRKVTRMVHNAETALEVMKYGEEDPHS